MDSNARDRRDAINFDLGRFADLQQVSDSARVGTGRRLSFTFSLPIVHGLILKPPEGHLCGAHVAVTVLGFGPTLADNQRPV